MKRRSRVLGKGENRKDRQRTIKLLLVLVGLLFLGSYLHKIGTMGGPKLWVNSGAMYRSDRMGEPVGADFTLFWAASYLSLNGNPAQVYDFSHLQALEQQLFGPAVGLPWPYPPTFLLMVLPFSLLPYLTSLAIWLAATLALFLIIMWRIGPHPLIFLLTLAFPGTFINFICGQNGFLSAALLGGGLLLLDRFPLVAGLLLGLLCFKPHLALLVPVALLAGRHWKALLGSLLSALGLSVASVSVFGWTVWVAFWHNLPFALKLLGDDTAPWQKMPSVFAAIMFMGGGVLLAWILQATVMIVVVAAVVWVWARGVSPAMRNSILILGLLLFPPHIFNYDLAMLALPLAWLGWEGYRKRYLLGEPILLALGWLLPLFFLSLQQTGIILPIGPLVLGALFIFTLRRAITSTNLRISNN
jgi:hypothetical protein